MPFYKNKKFWLVVGIAFVLAIIIFVGFLLRARISIEVIPARETEISIDGKAYNPKANKFWPGSHRIVIKKPGFVTYNESQKFGVNQKADLKIELKAIPEPAQISEGPASNLNPTPDRTNIDFIDKTRDRLVLYNPAGTARGKDRFRALTPDGALKDVDRVIWQPQQELALFKKGTSGGLYDFKRYDLISQTFNDWGKDIGDVFWQSKNQKLYYYYAPPTGERSIIQSNYNHDQIDRYFDLAKEAINNPQISLAPNEEVAIFTSDGIWRFDIQSKKISRLVRDKGYRATRIAPNSRWLVAIKDNQLVVMDLDGKNRQEWDYQVNPDQVSFVGDDEILAVVGGKLIKINLKTRTEEEFAASKDLSKISDLVVTADQKRIFFIENGLVYTLPLVSTRY